MLRNFEDYEVKHGLYPEVLEPTTGHIFMKNFIPMTTT